MIILAAIGVGGIGFATIAYPALTGSQQVKQSSSVSTLDATTIQHTASSACIETQTYGNITFSLNLCPDVISTGGGMDPTLLAAEILGLESPQVQAFVKPAYEYHVVYSNDTMAIPARVVFIVNVTGSQVVTGNWSSGYQISYTGNDLLNMTVVGNGTSYEVAHLTVYKLPDRNRSLSFTTQQRQVIQAALSDPKTQSLMVGGPYYAVYASSFGMQEMHVGPECADYNGNSSVVFDAYEVQFNQVNGYRNVVAYVDQNSTVVWRTWLAQYSAIGWNGTVLTDPWGAVKSQGSSWPQ
jgi:hypothetical protein